VTWQAVTFAGLALVLVGGFWWYERTRPSARLVALVAALAALAIAGRLVLAPIPNVVATTDIALITGYALGAGPGFAVGALAAPVSNIWLGQGPWTAWEMAGWGLVGLAGAWVGVITRRRLGRLGLATVCALAGFASGALLDLSLMVTYGGEQSLDRYLALSARGIPFNLAHATGNFVIALAAGPALVRMISRFRTRATFTWRPAGVLPVAILAVVLTGLVATRPADARRSAPGWLAGTQSSDGGFAAVPGQPSSPAMTGWAILGLEAAGLNPLDVRSGGETAVSYLRSQADRLRSVGDLERTILALVGAGLDPHRFAGTDLVADLRRRRDGDGSVDGQVNLTAFYALAIRAADGDAGSLGRSARWLRDAQNSDGGWGIQPRAPSESDSTGAALQGLIAAGARGRSTAQGASWLKRAQRPGGGWALGTTGVLNAQSTAWAVQGLAAAGGGGDAIRRAAGYLSRLRAADGHYRYSASSDQTPIWVTAQALLAVERAPFPLPAVARAQAQRQSGGSGGGEPGGSPGGDEDTDAGSGSGTPDVDGSAAANGDNGDGGAGAGEHATPEPGQDAGATEASAAAVQSGGPAVQPPEPATEAVPGAAPVSVAYTDGGSDDDKTTTYLLAGLAVLGAVVIAGLIRYRRRLD
jgi:energy-coupling factor transport system substrate-specific component